LDLISAASCSKLVEPKSRPEQNVCRIGEDKGNQNEDEVRNRDDAVSYAKFFSRSHHAVIRMYDVSGNVIETHEHTGDFKGDFVTRLGKRHARGLNPVTA